MRSITLSADLVVVVPAAVLVRAGCDARAVRVALALHAVSAARAVLALQASMMSPCARR